MRQFSTVGIIGKPTGGVEPYIRELVDIIRGHGATPVIEQATANKYFPEGAPCATLEGDQFCSNIDVCVIIGGDGSFLGAARLLASWNVPLIGVSAGRLGFVTDIDTKDMGSIIPAMLDGNYAVDERRMLAGSLFRDGVEIYHGLALNDIGISHGRALGMVGYTVYVDDLQMAVQHGDGVIVSTATGSTAYALAAGGPILHPGIKGMVIVPVAPHTLSNRPIVVASTSTVDIELNESRSAVASFDAQVLLDLVAGDVIHIHVNKDLCTMLHPVGYNHFELLRRKLRWNYHPQAETPVHVSTNETASTKQ